MAKLVSVLLIGFLLCTVGSFSFAIGTAHASSSYYVATTGSDTTGSGSLSSPWRTIQKAATVAQAGDTVNIRGGIYNETVTPSNSGTSGNPIIFKSYAGEDVIVSAADKVTGWTLDSGNVYYSTVNWDMGIGRNQVFVDNESMIEARYPNIGTETNIIEIFQSGNTFNANAYNDRVESSTLSQGTDYWKGGIYWGRHGDAYVAQSAKITGSSSGVINLDTSHSGQGWWSGESGKGFITGVRNALDQQREWYLDTTAHRLYFEAPSNQNPSSLNVYVKKRTLLFDLGNKNYITIDGIKGIGGGISMKGSTYCSVVNGSYKAGSQFWYFATATEPDIGNGFSDPALSTVYVSGHNNEVLNTTLEYGSGPLVLMSGQNNQVKDSILHDGGYAGTYGSGIFITNRDIGSGSAGGHQIIGNSIYRLGRSAVNWTAGTSYPSVASYLGSNVKFNHIFNYEMESVDGGALYSYYTNLGSDTKTVWAYNWIHDSNYTMGNGISSSLYADNNTTNLLMHHNVIWNDVEGVRINTNSQNIEIYNNTFWNVTRAMDQWTPNTNLKVYNNFSSSSSWNGDGDKQNNLTSSSPAFVGSGNAGLYYQLTSSSPAINYGRTVSGITDGYASSAPDVGAYEYGAGSSLSQWSAGVEPVTLPTSIINDNASGITYTGTWYQQTGRGVGGYSDDVHYSYGSADSTYVQYTFTGTGVQFISEKYSDMGTLDIYIDNNFQRTVDCFSSGSRESKAVVYSVTGLSGGSHTIKVVKRSGTSTAMIVDAFNVTNTSTVINDNASGVSYTGTWYYQSGRGVGGYIDDIHYSYGIADSTYVQYTFTGTGIQFFSEKYSDMGTMDVYIDNTFQQTVDSYTSGSRVVRAVLFSATGLGSGSHTIKVVKRSGASAVMVVDAFLVN